ncbi:MAG TPA: Crp/Fnr family transcriptional regulator [Pyrinomonadaceae bacterium]|nr:Crp/Fnr family transcriptional regulator [Pyrinomonadaceae bacterium]
MSINIHSPSTERREIITASVASQNELLAGLLSIPAIATTLLPELKIVPLAINQVLYEVGDKLDHVYLPLDSVVSCLVITEDGTTIETSMIGREGMVGISSILGSGISRQWVSATVSGNAMQLEVRLLEKLFVQNEAALKSLLRCFGTRITQVSQRCVCNTRHTIVERLCCWLLMVHDRVCSSKLMLTQEMIASRVGARRAGITVAAGVLQEIGAIEYRRGHLHIRRREVLEQTVCECYKVMKIEPRQMSASTRSL